MVVGRVHVVLATMRQHVITFGLFKLASGR
jgi:hypothetical protein